jgi:hypothetical protein
MGQKYAQKHSNCLFTRFSPTARLVSTLNDTDRPIYNSLTLSAAAQCALIDIQNNHQLLLLSIVLRVVASKALFAARNHPLPFDIALA